MPKILVVDDSADMVLLLVATLKMQGYQTAAVHRGEDALRLVAADAPDLILLDVNMPGISGLETCRRLKADPGKSRIPVIIITSNDSDEAIAEGLDVGADDYVTKPFSTTVLAARIRSALRAKAAGDELRDANRELEKEIHERHRVEEALSGVEEQLRQSQKLEAVGRLAGGIAHEFNNLIQAISGYSRYAMDGLPADDLRRQDLEQVIQAADRAATLTRQLLGFSRRKTLDRRNVDLNEVVAELIKMVRPILGERFALDVSLKEKVGTINADPAQLQQALLNLCINARDAMPSGGTVTLRTDAVTLSKPTATVAGGLPPGSYVLIQVADTGCGMSPEVQQRLFEPFFTTKEVGKGTGLGLALVFGVVQQHGGGIRVESRKGQGACFKIYLPIVDDCADASCRELPPSAREGNETVLVAEDDLVVRELAVRTLRKAGYKTLIAGDGAEALRIYLQHRGEISLLLLDVVTPKLSGHEVYQRVRAVEPEIKVLFCTGYDPVTAQSHLLTQDNLPLLQKPFTRDDLLCRVRETLDRKKNCEVAATRR